MNNETENETASAQPENGALDFDAHYRVEGYRGIAWYLIGYKKETVFHEIEDANEFYDCEAEEVEDRSRVIAVMVGDDRRFTFDVEEVSPIDEDDFCHSCGQIGCTHDGRERD